MPLFTESYLPRIAQRRSTKWLALGVGLLFLSPPVSAHGIEGIFSYLAFPILTILATHLIPVADFLRRKKWGYAVLFVIVQPIIWLIAICFGAIFSELLFDGGLTLTVVAVTLLVFAALPFVLWWFLVRVLRRTMPDNSPTPGARKRTG